jgi:hypothetical protein
MRGTGIVLDQISEGGTVMVSALPTSPPEQSLFGVVQSPTALDEPWRLPGDDLAHGDGLRCEAPDDPFDDFEEDDFDDDFDDDFEEDWEDDLTEDDEFPDTFGGEEPEEEVEGEDEESPFADDPDFDD